MMLEERNNQRPENIFASLLSVYIIVDTLLKWMAMYYPFRNGVVAAVILMSIILLVFLNDRLKLVLDSINSRVLIYILYSVFLMFISYAKGYEMSILIREFSGSLAPIFVFFVARRMSSRQASIFERSVFIVSIVLLVSGLYYNTTLSDPYYIRFLEENYKGFALHWFKLTPRLSSFYGSVVCGTYGCVLMLLSFRMFSLKNKKRFIIRYFVGSSLAILSLQRSAMLCAVFFTIFVFIVLVRNKIIKPIIPVIMLISIVLAIMVINTIAPQLVSGVIYRFSEMKTAVDERSGGWMNAFGNGLFSTIFGFGTGTGGQRAIGVSIVTVNDGNYFKMIYEIGIVGILLWIRCVFKAIKDGIRSESKKIYAIILMAIMVQMIGSNILTFGSTALLFWYAMGRIYSDTMS